MNGSETLGWSQSAPTRTELDAYEYAAYVDGQRGAMTKPSCAAIDSQTYDCRAPLPRMSIGRHTLELSASLNGFEGARSAALLLTVGNAVQAIQGQPLPPSSANTARATNGLAVPAPPRERACIGADDCYDVERVSTSLADPRALALVPDGRIVIAEDDTRLVAFSDGSASQLQVESPCRAPAHSRISAVAADPMFLESRLVYVAWSCDSVRYPRELLVVRYREINGTLGEAASVFREAGVANGDAFVAVTRSARLVVASREADHWDVARVTTDGRVPPESAKASPLLLQRRSVSALTTDANGDRVMFATGDGRVEALGVRCATSDVGTRIAALGIAADGNSILVATEPHGMVLQRFVLNAAGCVRPTPASGGFDFGAEVIAIAPAPDGSIVVLTRSQETSTADSPTGFIIRLRPSSAGR